MAQTLTDKIIVEYGSMNNFPRHFDYRSAHELEDSLVESIDAVLALLQVHIVVKCYSNGHTVLSSSYLFSSILHTHSLSPLL